MHGDLMSITDTAWFGTSKRKPGRASLESSVLWQCRASRRVITGNYSVSHRHGVLLLCLSLYFHNNGATSIDFAALARQEKIDAAKPQESGKMWRCARFAMAAENLRVVLPGDALKLTGSYRDKRKSDVLEFPRKVLLEPR